MKRNDKPPEPPAHLRESTRAWWSSVVSDYILEPHHLKLLTAAAEAWDEAEAAGEAIREHGLTFVDRYGQAKERPELGTRRQARRDFARMVRELALDAAPPPDATRPPRAGGWQY